MHSNSLFLDNMHLMLEIAIKFYTNRSLPIEYGTRLRIILEGILLRNLIKRPWNRRYPIQLIS